MGPQFRVQDKGCVAYEQLARMAASEDEHLWVLRPKLHAACLLKRSGICTWQWMMFHGSKGWQQIAFIASLDGPFCTYWQVPCRLVRGGNLYSGDKTVPGYTLGHRLGLYLGNLLSVQKKFALSTKK